MVIELLMENQYMVSDTVYLINFIVIKILEKDKVLLKIVLDHNNDYTSTYTQEDCKQVVNKNNTPYNN
jgi:hypothetical protein